MSDFNLLTLNGKAFPGTPPAVAKRGDRGRMRFGNLSAIDHHPIHLHGHYLKLVATDVMNLMGQGIPNMVGMTPGDLNERIRPLLPGYMTMGHDGMRDMGAMGAMGMGVPKNSIPMIGAHGQFDYITMGGMFTSFKLRENLDGYADPGHFDSPPGQVATLADPDQMRRDLGQLPS